MSVLAWCCHNFNFSWPSFLYNVDQGNTCFLSKFKLTWPKSPGWSQVLLHAEAILLCKTKFDGLCVYPLVIEGLASPPLRTSKGHISNAFETIGVVLNPLVSRPCRTPLSAVALHPTYRILLPSLMMLGLQSPDASLPLSHQGTGSTVATAHPMIQECTSQVLGKLFSKIKGVTLFYIFADLFNIWK